MSQTRRNFIKNSAGLTAAALLSPLEEFAASGISKNPAKEGFELLFMQTDWGFGGSREDFCAAAKKEGYQGIEVWWPGDNAEAQKELFDAVKKHNLKIGFLCGGHQAVATDHLELFKKNLDAICANPYQKPVYVNCHSGKDYFTYEQNKRFIDYTTEKTKTTGIPVYHETHRGRMLFATTVTRDFAERNPELRLTLDISHWCNVHEGLLSDQKETVDFLLTRVDHIHSRIGHAQGPQVNDPRAPEWEHVVKAHLAWWDKVVERKKQNGERMTILTEFGPGDYMPALPYTRQPVADQWAINVYMMNLLRKRYQS
ncbi:sugar phosphate isomerase/epimerase family protein [Pedobacter nyackensis]|uniref:Tat (Twin-arginine translocation) pathway signal sequence n=1 Tax=Pedobacter nyackensis TaxID=475255 RepID=A0A1W2DZR4_9SPHI|nr:twin-arginine translocation signal domain-containing protein [Pedobacter nyackensis]SMD02994.1 Tat (twin-arginine translocation) pathway signal sequence [Pedobacter nyackensis]